MKNNINYDYHKKENYLRIRETTHFCVRFHGTIGPQEKTGHLVKAFCLQFGEWEIIFVVYVKQCHFIKSLTLLLKDCRDSIWLKIEQVRVSKQKSLKY